MFDRNKRPIVIEINPRQSGSVAVSLAAGHKVYENLIRMFLEKNTTRNQAQRKNYNSL